MKFSQRLLEAQIRTERNRSSGFSRNTYQNWRGFHPGGYAVSNRTISASAAGRQCYRQQRGAGFIGGECTAGDQSSDLATAGV